MAEFPTIEYGAYQHGWDYQSYDAAAAQLFNSLRVVDANTRLPTEKPIPLVFATPERAWGLMRKKFGKAPDDPNFKVPLPFISLAQMGDASFDSKRYLYNKILYRKVAISPDFRKCLSHPKPQPYSFQYAAELWVKTRYEARVAAAEFAGLFEEGALCYRIVDHGTPLGKKLVPFFLQGITDTTNLDTGDGERSLRWSLSFRIDGWLQPKVIEQNLVHDVNVTINAPDSLCNPDPYGRDELDGFLPMTQGNPQTGEVVQGDEAFDPDYNGVDYRTWRISPAPACVE